METIIRTFDEGDLEEASTIMAESFEAKFTRLADLSVPEIAELSVHLGISYPRPFHGYLVAQTGESVSGVIVLKWKGQDRLSMPMRWRKARKLGLWNAVKTLFGMILLDTSPKAGECYIEHVAVSSEHRGMGIGTMLIEEGERIARRSGLPLYSLYVAESNEGAVRLYQSLGFSIDKRVKSWLTKRIFGIPVWYRMVKALDQEIDDRR